MQLEIDDATVYVDDTQVVANLETALRDASRVERRGYVYIERVLQLFYNDGSQSSIILYVVNGEVVYYHDGWDYRAPAADAIVLELLERAEKERDRQRQEGDAAGNRRTTENQAVTVTATYDGLNRRNFVTTDYKV